MYNCHKILEKVQLAQSLNKINQKEKKKLLKHMILYCQKGESAIESEQILEKILLLFDSYKFIKNIQQDTFNQLDTQHNTVIKDLDPLILETKRKELKEKTKQLTYKIFRTSKCQFFHPDRQISNNRDKDPDENINIYIILQGKVRVGNGKILNEGYHFEQNGEQVIAMEDTYLLVIRQLQMNKEQQMFIRGYNQERLGWLGEVSVLKNWDVFGLWLLGSRGEYQYYRTNQEVYTIGSKDTCIYFVQEGEVHYQRLVMEGHSKVLAQRTDNIYNSRHLKEVYQIQSQPLNLQEIKGHKQQFQQSILQKCQFFGEFEPLIMGQNQRMSKAKIYKDSSIVMKIEINIFKHLLAKYGNGMDFYQTICQRYDFSNPQVKAQEEKVNDPDKNFTEGLSDYNIFKHKINFTYKKGEYRSNKQATKHFDNYNKNIQNTNESFTNKEQQQQNTLQFSQQNLFSIQQTQENGEQNYYKNICTAVSKQQFDFSYHQKMNRLFRVPQISKKKVPNNFFNQQNTQTQGNQSSFKEELIQNSILQYNDTNLTESTKFQKNNNLPYQKKNEIIIEDLQIQQENKQSLPVSLRKRANSNENLAIKQKFVKYIDQSLIISHYPKQICRSVTLQEPRRVKSQDKPVKKKISIKINPIMNFNKEIPRKECTKQMTTKMFESRSNTKRAQMNMKCQMMKQKMLSQISLKGKKPC